MDVQAIFKALADKNQAANQTLDRRPEPYPITDSIDSVNEYQEMMKTNMTANYALVLDLIDRTTSNRNREGALDLCCGPGHISICLKQYLGFESVTGVDLSPTMVDAAHTNSHREGIGSLEFQLKDAGATNLTNGRQYDLVLMTNAAHHLINLQYVGRVLEEAERSVQPHGLIIITDLARLKNETITKDFVAFAGAEYGDHMREDFLNSMYAAWLPSELVSAIPSNSKRTWFSMYMRDLPFFQALIGIPSERTVLFSGKSQNWFQSGIFPNVGSEQAFAFMSDCLYGGPIQVVRSPSP